MYLFDEVLVIANDDSWRRRVRLVKMEVLGFREIKPLLLSYEKANIARCWAQITAQLVGIQLSPNIPEHDFFRKYGPDFQLKIAVGSRPEENTDSYLLMIQEKVLSNLKNIVRKE